jgi:Protein of unknown function (DUF742)
VNHWSEERFDDDAPEDALVRPYTITRDRTLPERADLSLITLVTILDARIDPGWARGPQPEHRMIIERCHRPTAVAEIAAGQQPDIRLLQAVRDGLFRL